MGGKDLLTYLFFLFKFAGRSHMDVIQEVEMNGIETSIDETRAEDEQNSRSELAGWKVLDHIRVNVEPETPISILKNILSSTSDLQFTRKELRKAEDKMKQALVEFHRKLRLLKNYR